MTVSQESQNVRRGQAVAATFQVALLYSAVALPAQMLREAVTPDIFLLFLSFWGSLCFFVLWRRIDWSGYRFMSFGPLFLLTSALFKLDSFLFILFYGNQLDEWPVHATDPLLSVAYGQLIFVVGALVLVGTWLAFRGHERSIEIISGWRYDLPTLGFAYVIGAGTSLSIRVFDLNLLSLGAIVSVFYYLGPISILLISLGSPHRRTWQRCVLLPSVLSLPLIYAALHTGFKEHIMFSTLAILAGIFVVIKGKLARTVVCLMLGGLYVFMTAFVNIQRGANWEQQENLSVARVVDITADALRADNEFLGDTVRGALMRKYLLEINGWSVDIVENIGHLEGFAPDRAFAIFIPRILWAEKPQFRPGNDFTELMFGPELGETSGTAAGFFSVLYLGSGVWGVLVYSMILGALYALSLAVVIRVGSSFAQVLFLFGSVYRALRLDEAWPVYEFAGLISLLILAISLGALVSFMQKRTRRVRLNWQHQ